MTMGLDAFFKGVKRQLWKIGKDAEAHHDDLAGLLGEVLDRLAVLEARGADRSGAQGDDLLGDPDEPSLHVLAAETALLRMEVASLRIALRSAADDLDV